MQAIALVAAVEVVRDLLRPRRRKLAIEVRQVVFQEFLTRHETAGVGLVQATPAANVWFPRVAGSATGETVR